MQTQPHIFTFYSFKGGVGRSMALLNVAHSLVARGRDVLILDLDLEAPGITGFLEDNEELQGSSPRDVLDMVAWAKEVSVGERAGQHDPAKNLLEAPPFESFVVGVKPGHIIESKLGRCSHLDIIGARLRDESYLRRLSALGLGSLSKDQLILVSKMLRKFVFAARIPVDIPDYFPASVVRDKPYDYVLVDSRTGFTEIGGLCVGPLADRVLLFTSLNDQNIAGTKHFVDTVGLDPIADPTTYAEDPQKREKPSLIVVSPVPYGDITCRDDRLAKVTTGVGPVAAHLTYHLQMALRESNFVREHPAENLAAEYRQLTKLVMEFVGDDADSLAREILNVSSKGRANLEREENEALAQGKVQLVENPKGSARYFPLVRDLAQKQLQQTSAIGPPSICEWISKLLLVYAEDPVRAETLLEGALPYLKEESLDDFVAADRLFEVLTRTGSFERWRSWANWASALNYCISECKTLDAALVDKLLEEARLKLEQAESSATRDYDRLSFLPVYASVLSEKAKKLPLPGADVWFEQSRQKLEQVLRIAPSVPITRNIAHSYRDQAEKYPDGEKSDQLFASAFAAYENAESLDQHHHSAATRWSWARALQFHARKKSGDEMHRRFKLAYEMYVKALKIAPQKAAIMAQWGEALLDEAKRTDDILAAERILKEAMPKLELNRAIVVKEYHEIDKAILEAKQLSVALAAKKTESKTASI